MANTTGWIDGKQKPTEEGWYEVRRTTGKIDREYWNGCAWCPDDRDSPYPTYDQDVIPWRGLSSNA